MRSRNPRPNRPSTHWSASLPHLAKRIQKFRETCHARSWRESSRRGRKEPRVLIQIRFTLVRRLQSPSKLIQSPSKPIQSPSSQKTDSVSLSLSQSDSASLSNGLSLSLLNRRPPLSLKSDPTSLPFPQILYIRDLGLSKFLCFDLHWGFVLFLLFCFDSRESFPLMVFFFF